MGLKDHMIETAVSEAFDQSGLEPGELNNKIDSVMDTLEEASERLDQAEEFQDDVKGDIQDLQKGAEILAEASITVSERAEEL